MALNIKSLEECIDIANRRKYHILFPWLLFSAIAVLIAYNLPKTFRSTATMLYEAPFPAKIFDATISQFADEKIQSIYQRAMATDNVLSIIESAGVYDDIKEEFTDHELADLFRESTEVNLATSSVTPRASSGMAEIAFEISFSHNDPVKAKEVVEQLMSLFVEQNDKTRKLRATKATDFLLEESEKLNHHLQEVDNKIAQYKEQNNFSLPEQTQNSLAAIDRIENELKDTDSHIRSTKERIAYLEAELARAQDELPIKLDDKMPQTRDETLRILKAQYLKLSAIYSPTHPSLVRIKREIKTLDPSFIGKLDDSDAANQLEDNKTKLKLLEKTYSGNHPDIAKLKNQIVNLEQQVNRVTRDSQDASKKTGNRHASPAYIGVEAQYRSYQTDLQSLQEKHNYLQAKLEKMQGILMVAPQVEKGYNDLIRERDNTVKKYAQLKEKLLDARLYQTQEEQQQGQTLTVIEPPVEPMHPEKAIRRKVAIGGFFLGLMAGFALALLAEFLDSRLRGYRAVAEATGLMPLIVIPYIESPSEVDNKLARRLNEKKMIVWLLVFAVILASSLLFFFFSPSERN